MEKKENPVMKLTGKIVKRDVRGFLHQPVRPQSLQHKDVTEK